MNKKKYFKGSASSAAWNITTPVKFRSKKDFFCFEGKMKQQDGRERDIMDNTRENKVKRGVGKDKGNNSFLVPGPITLSRSIYSPPKNIYIREPRYSSMKTII